MSDKTSGGFPLNKSDEQWRKELTPEQYRVLRKHGTERAGTSALNHEKRKGVYFCAGCGAPLFESGTKYESGSGWPSFYEARENAVETEADNSLLMQRTEVHCAKCGGHLGYVFDDGPEPTGERYCINGLALKFEEQK
jgi:peptide-methionine (R)-S-oxide reductase